MLSNHPALIELYRRALLDDVVPFWEKYSIDRECGGYLICLERDGTVFDTDKFIWFQARSVWMFSALYLEVEKRPEWLELARHGIAFLEKYGRDAAGDWYFSGNFPTPGGNKVSNQAFVNYIEGVTTRAY